MPKRCRCGKPVLLGGAAGVFIKAGLYGPPAGGGKRAGLSSYMEDRLPNVAVEELDEVLRELGQIWAKSLRRPRPKVEILERWDEFLDAWLKSDLPLVLRDGGRRGTTIICSNGRSVIFSDNSPASWAFHRALAGSVPEIADWRAHNIRDFVPVNFIGRRAPRDDLNRIGWKICHIEPVSDRRRYDLRKAPIEIVTAKFLRFMSPRNMFLIPKVIAGAGEIPQVVKAIAAFNVRDAQ